MFFSTQSTELSQVAKCHILAFPDSFSSKLGRRYVAKMLGWYLSTEKAFIFHLKDNGEVVGYCGAIVVDGTLPTGAASGMTQYSFNDAIKAMVFRPWLLLHPEVTKRYKFLWRNVKAKLGISKPKFSAEQKTIYQNEPQIGLVVIGVDPKMQGKGYGSMILQEFEKRAATYNIPKLQLTVKAINTNAIRAYENGWEAVSNDGEVVAMYKYLAQTVKS